MKVFLSYSSKQGTGFAERVALAIRSYEHEVFWDRDTLLPGLSYDNLISKEIEGCDLLIFLVTPGALDEGTYCLAELKICQRAKPNPSGTVMAVLINGVKLGYLPEYLRATTVLFPMGEVAAEVAYCVNDLLRRRRLESSIRAGRGISALKLYRGAEMKAWVNRPFSTVFELLVDDTIIARASRPASASIFSGFKTIFGWKPRWTIRGQTTIKACTMMLRADFVTEFSDQRIELFLDDAPLDVLGSYTQKAQKPE